jgi:hypothetical protein
MLGAFQHLRDPRDHEFCLTSCHSAKSLKSSKSVEKVRGYTRQESGFHNVLLFWWKGFFLAYARQGQAESRPALTPSARLGHSSHENAKAILKRTPFSRMCSSRTSRSTRSAQEPLDHLILPHLGGEFPLQRLLFRHHPGPIDKAQHGEEQPEAQRDSDIPKHHIVCVQDSRLLLPRRSP